MKNKNTIFRVLAEWIEAGGKASFTNPEYQRQLEDFMKAREVNKNARDFSCNAEYSK